VSGAYRGRGFALATMHGKQRAIERPLLRHLGARLAVADGVDTDALGTFAGEVKRPGPPRATAIEKARLGMAAAGLPQGLASEGSFAPHPALFFVPADHEIVAFVDDERGIELCESVLSLRTNFAHLDARPGDDLGPFLRRVRFPSHALIVRPLATDGDARPIAKGVADPAELVRAIRTAAGRSPLATARIETDMRAHLNPARMAVIRAAAGRLARRLATDCPDCGAPGWGQVAVERGLPCRGCATPTALVAAVVHGCAVCPARRRTGRPDGRTAADPGDCPACNP